MGKIITVTPSSITVRPLTAEEEFNRSIEEGQDKLRRKQNRYLRLRNAEYHREFGTNVEEFLVYLYTHTLQDYKVSRAQIDSFYMPPQPRS